MRSISYSSETYNPSTHILKLIESRFENNSNYEVLILLRTFFNKYISPQNYYGILEILYKNDSDAYVKLTGSTQNLNMYYIEYDTINRENINTFLEYLSNRINYALEQQRYSELMNQHCAKIISEPKPQSDIIRWLQADLHMYSHNKAKQVEYIYHFIEFNSSSDNVDDFLILIKKKK